MKLSLDVFITSEQVRKLESTGFLQLTIGESTESETIIPSGAPERIVKLLYSRMKSAPSDSAFARQVVIAKNLLKENEEDLLRYCILNSEKYTDNKKPIYSLNFLSYCIKTATVDYVSNQNLKERTIVAKQKLDHLTTSLPPVEPVKIESKSTSFSFPTCPESAADAVVNSLMGRGKDEKPITP